MGVNRFTQETHIDLPRLAVDPAIEQEQRRRLEDLVGRRDNANVQAKLDKVRRVAQGEDNLMPAILEAVNAYATLGEICDALRGVFGEYEQVITI